LNISGLRLVMAKNKINAKNNRPKTEIGIPNIVEYMLVVTTSQETSAERSQKDVLLASLMNVRYDIMDKPKRANAIINIRPSLKGDLLLFISIYYIIFF